MGDKFGHSGIQNRIYRKSSNPNVFNKFAGFQSQGSGSSGGYSAVPGFRGDNPGTRVIKGHRLLLQPLSGTQTKWYSQANPQFKKSKCILKNNQIQNGVHSLGDCEFGARGVSSVFGHKRCLPPCPYMASSSKVFKVCVTGQAFPIPSLAFRPVIGSQSLYQNNGSNDGVASFPGSDDNSVSGRSLNQGTQQGDPSQEYLVDTSAVIETRMDHQLRQIKFNTIPEIKIPRDDTGYSPEESFPSSGQGRGHQKDDCGDTKTAQSICSHMYTPTGEDGGYIRSHSIWKVPLPAFTTGLIEPVDRVSSVSTTDDNLGAENKIVPHLVAEFKPSSERQNFRCRKLDAPGYRCESERLGSSDFGSHFPRPLVTAGRKVTDKLSGNKSSFLCSSKSTVPSPRKGYSSAVGQCDSSGVYKSPRRNPQQKRNERSKSRSALGGDSRTSVISSFRARNRKLGSGLLKPPGHSPGGMGVEHRSVSNSSKQVGSTTDRPDGLKTQSQATTVLCPDEGSKCSGSRRIDSPMGFPIRVCISSVSNAASTSQKNQELRGKNTPDSARLATQSMVLSHPVPTSGRAMASTTKKRSSTARPAGPSRFTAVAFDGMATERAILKSRGFPPSVITTMMAARKEVTSKHYHRIWKAYIKWCEGRRVSTTAFKTSRFLMFLQAGFEAGLRLGSLKVQVSALSIYFQRKIAVLPEIQTFLQGVLRLQPPFVAPTMPWDLELVLSFLQSPLFEPLESTEMKYLSWKVVMLLALVSARRVSDLSALSCKSPYLVFHNNRAELRTKLGFLPKVVSSFHINQPIVVPMLEENSPSARSLDVVRALKIYVERTATVRKTDALFILYDAVRPGWPASKQTLARWIRLTIQQAYVAAAKTPPPSIAAHSTRSMGPSWAAARGVSIEKLCRAATWSGRHTFLRFYKFDTLSASDTQFGRSVLQGSQGYPSQ